MSVVAKSLTGIYRPVALWFFGIVAVVVLLTGIVWVQVADLDRSVWQLIAGQATKYWLLVVGVLLTGTHLRLYVANGVTRRAFLLGAGLFGGLSAVLFAAMIPLGRVVEWLAWKPFGVSPGFSAASAVRDFGFYLPGALGALVGGALVAAGFYRWNWWKGLLLIVPFAMPMAVAEVLFGLYASGAGPTARFLPFAAGAPVSLLVTAAGVVVLHRVLKDVTIRRSGG